MTAHDHARFIAGCYRCDLSRAEVEQVVDAPLDDVARVAEEQMAKWKTTLDWLAER